MNPSDTHPPANISVKKANAVQNSSNTGPYKHNILCITSSAADDRTFMLEGLEFDKDTVHIFCTGNIAKHLTCTVHFQDDCYMHVQNNLPFVFKLDSVDNKQVQCAWVVEFGLPSCNIGYIPSSTIPYKALHHILHSVYQIVFEEADVNVNTDAHENLEVLKGVHIGKASNMLINSN